MVRRFLIYVILASTAAFAAPAFADSTQQTIAFEGHARSYALYVPDQAGPRPLLVLLHGSGSNGLFMLGLWKTVAAREGIVLLAPDSLHTDIGWDLHADGPDFIRAAIDAVVAAHPVDPHRLYVFGQSGGAVYALTLAMLESEYFAAVAFHAGGWRRPAEYAVANYAKRKIPIAIFVGDRDEYFSLPSVQETQHVLAERGFPVELNVLKDRQHTILDVPPDFYDGVWNFLSQHTLAQDPNFTLYRAP